MFSMGSAFKKARISKGYTQKEVAEGILSISQLSKFENGQNDITLSKCLRLLEKLHLDLAEFYEVHIITNPSEMVLDFEFSNTLLFMDEIDLKYKLADEIVKYEITNSTLIQHRLIILKQIIRLKQGLPLDTYEINQIYSYLAFISEWGLYEMCLFSNTLFAFNRMQIINLINMSLKQTYHYIDAVKLSHFQQHLIVSLQRLCLKLIQESEFRLAQRIHKDILPLIHRYYFTKCYLLNQYITGRLYLLDDTSYEKGIQLMQEVKSLALKVGDRQLSKLLTLYEDDSTSSTNEYLD